jgi:hypothetical protein
MKIIEQKLHFKLRPELWYKMSDQLREQLYQNRRLYWEFKRQIMTQLTAQITRQLDNPICEQLKKTSI